LIVEQNQNTSRFGRNGLDGSASDNFRQLLVSWHNLLACSTCWGISAIKGFQLRHEFALGSFTVLEFQTASAIKALTAAKRLTQSLVFARVYEKYVAQASAEVQGSYRDAQAAAQSEKGIRLTDRTRLTAKICPSRHRRTKSAALQHVMRTRDSC
jgi:hypothetical protein